ncbi:hypothetical protein B484DRAFT_265647 [Ochromonadaceae sp. CCMP2298]|nr:hypothetical protein B484DRAFT_265647 [Ochromonadaceae sp. CCMP2298]
MRGSKQAKHWQWSLPGFVSLLLTLALFLTVFLCLRSGAPATVDVEDKRLVDVVQMAEAEEDFAAGLDILHIDGKKMQAVDTIYVIPGGGSSADGGYPEWTRRRVQEAFDAYRQRAPSSGRALFLALSAGSLNSPNVLFDDRQIMFECQHAMQHLTQLGVPKEDVVGDTFSWDTVTNGLTLRMVVEAVQAYRTSYPHEADKQVAPLTPLTPLTPLAPLCIEVYISDFHADRVRAAFDWVLGLKPPVLASGTDAVVMRIHSVSSQGIEWPSPADYALRIEHEQQGERRIRLNAQHIRTLGQFQAFLVLGGHQGLHRYLHQEYSHAPGAGW